MENIYLSRWIKCCGKIHILMTNIWLKLNEENKIYKLKYYEYHKSCDNP